MLWLQAENLFNEVIYDVSVIAGKGSNKGIDVVPSP